VIFEVIEKNTVALIYLVLGNRRRVGRYLRKQVCYFKKRKDYEQAF
jgi:hypothetical protein